MGKLKHLICGEIIESKHRHDLASCSCYKTGKGGVALDGGNDYLRIIGDMQHSVVFLPDGRQCMTIYL